MYTASAASTEAFMMSMKPGCRGDPRMNRAVAAKLKNPHISLFDALAIGGFNYPRNVDAATMDNDRVTLGQRKNQLNRRLRLARQSLQKDKKKREDDELDCQNFCFLVAITANHLKEAGASVTTGAPVPIRDRPPLLWFKNTCLAPAN